MRALILASFGLLVGCSKPAGDAPSPTPVASASVAPTASVAAPMMKEYAAPPSDRVGVLAPGTGIPVGQKVPDVHARDLDGKDVALSSVYAKGPILLAFYRGGWCPYCNTEIHSFTTAYPDYVKRGVTPVAASVDLPDFGAKTKATYTIPFPVLSDSSASMIEGFHVAKKVGDDEYAKMRGFGVDLEARSGEKLHEMAIPALFVIDQKGIIRWAHSDPDFKVRPTTAQILAAIDGLHLGGS